MVVLKQIFWFASIVSAGWVLGSKKALQDEDLKQIIDGIWDAEQAVFRKLQSPSAHSQVFWKNDKSTPPSSLNYKAADNETLLDFDDIETTSPLTNLTSYKNMTFTSYKVLNIPLAINSSLLDPEDIDSTFSSPNAIVGSPSFSPHSTLPRIFVSLCSRTTSSSPSQDCPNEFPYRFQPISILVKPIGFVPKGKIIVMEVDAWELEGREVVHVYGAFILWGGGNGEGRFTKPLRLGMKHWGEGRNGKKGKGMNVLEIRYYEWVGKKGERRGFVVDDLVVGVLDRGGEDEVEREGRVVSKTDKRVVLCIFMNVSIMVLKWR